MKTYAAFGILLGSTLWMVTDGQACVIGQAAKMANASPPVSMMAHASDSALIKASEASVLEDAGAVVDTGCGAVAAFTAAGTVQAVATGSAATIMTTMAGASTLTGVTTVAAPGLAVAGVLNHTVYSHCDHQHACDNAQAANYVGTGLGTLGSVAVLSAYGAGPTGLAAIGGVIGGGMAAGALTVLAIPAAATLALGGFVYWMSGD